MAPYCRDCCSTQFITRNSENGSSKSLSSPSALGIEGYVALLGGAESVELQSQYRISDKKAYSHCEFSGRRDDKKISGAGHDFIPIVSSLSLLFIKKSDCCLSC